MPRKPNYRFERSERAKTKAAKKAERHAAKVRKSEERKFDGAEDHQENSPSN